MPAGLEKGVTGDSAPWAKANGSERQTTSKIAVIFFIMDNLPKKLKAGIYPMTNEMVQNPG